MKRIEMNKKNEDITIKEAYEQFVRVKKAMKMEDTSLSTYRYAYNELINVIDENELCASIDSDIITDILEYFAISKSHIKNATLLCNMRHIRAILYFFMSRGYMAEFKIQMPQKIETIKATYTDKELELLLKKPNMKMVEFCEYRNWVMVNYLLGTGNRLNTILNLKIGDLDLEEHEVILRTTKNKQQQIVPIPSSLVKILSEYLEVRQGEVEDYLFPTFNGTQLSKRGAESTLEEFNKNKGVSVGMHKFRHTFAKKWILNGGDIFRLQKILGHKSLEMVKNYVQMFSADLHNNYDKFNPLENMSIQEKQKIKMKKNK